MPEHNQYPDKYHYVYTFQKVDMVKHYYAVSRVEADKQFEADIGYAPVDSVVLVTRLNS